MVSFPCVDVVVQQRLMTVPARGNFATNRFQTHSAPFTVSQTRSLIAVLICFGLEFPYFVFQGMSPCPVRRRRIK